MLENPTPTVPAGDTAIKRYAPPNQRNHPLNRQKSAADRLDRANHLHGNDVEKNQAAAASKNFPMMDHGDPGRPNLLNERPRSGLIALEGCSRSEASQLLNDRWLAALHSYDNPSIEFSERPVMCSGGVASAWGQFRLPHQMDFLGELRRAMRNANATFGP